MSPSNSKGKAGKRFEEDFQASCESAGLYVFKLRDCGGWGSDSALRFTPSNPFDFFVYDGKMLLALELKSTGGASLRYDALRDNQEAGLTKAKAHKVVAGVLVNFRRENRVFFIDIASFGYMENWSKKKSFNVEEAEKAGIEILPVELPSNRRPRWRVRGFITKARSLL